MQRRDFVRLSVAAAGVAVGSAPLRRAIASVAQGGWSPYGELGDADENGVQLPRGFRSRVVARAGATVGSTDYVWPVYPDGGATFRVRDGWIYVANTEWVPPSGGGVSAIRFDRRGNIVDAYPICTGTLLNCAGGPTPWGTWLTCEEFATGHVWECDPTGQTPAEKRPALGTFQHEAVAVDPSRRQLYLTEDFPEGRLYRFTPDDWPNLASGRLEAAEVREDGSVAWHEIPRPNEPPTRTQAPASTIFRGGEGITYSRGNIYFTTKGDNRVWRYDPRRQRIALLYETKLDPAAQLSGVDNVTAATSGDLVVAEDGGNMELVLITPGGYASALVRVLGQEGSELAGPAFSPAGDRLYFSSQRGDGSGITYEVSGPFRRKANDPRPSFRVPTWMPLFPPLR